MIREGGSLRDEHEKLIEGHKTIVGVTWCVLVGEKKIIGCVTAFSKKICTFYFSL